MVDAGRAELDRQPYAGTRPQLVAVHAQPEPGRSAGLQDGPRLVLGEGVGGVRLAEHVDPAGVRRGGREHRAGDQVHVAGPVVPPLRRHDVGPEQRGLGGHLAGDPQQPGLVVDGEPVAALDLHRGGAGGPELGHPGRQPAAELVVARVPGGGDRGGDPAAVVGRPRSSGRRTPPRGRRRRPGGCARRRSRAARCGRRRRPGRRRAVRSSRGPSQAMRPSSTTTAASVRIPSRSSPVSSQVTSSPIPVTTVLVMPTPSRARASSGPTGPSRCSPSATIVCPGHHHPVDVGGGRRQRDLGRVGTGGPDRVGPDHHEVRRRSRPRSPRPPASRGWRTRSASPRRSARRE